MSPSRSEKTRHQGVASQAATPPMPPHYSNLGPFRGLFEQGLAILTYHKVGPRPRAARLKGLYLSQRLFEKQLKELTEGGYQWRTMDEAAEQRQGRSVALTMDDGFRNNFVHGLEPLVRHQARATVFLVANRLGGLNEWESAQGEVPEQLMNAEEIRHWLRSGQRIGSHTLTHPHLTRISPALAREEINASRKKLEDLFGLPVRHFCYPYGDWNPTIRDMVREAGYLTACTTQPGLNTPDTPAHELRRLTARYPSRSLKTFVHWLRRLLASAKQD